MYQILIPAVTSLIDKLIPDEKEANAAKLRAMEMAQQGQLKELDAMVDMAKSQMDINKVEASTDNFRGGWRPAAGWVCVFGLCYQFILQPILPWAIGLFDVTTTPLPSIDNDTLMALLFGMLGLGGFRTIERVKGKV